VRCRAGQRAAVCAEPSALLGDEWRKDRPDTRHRVRLDVRLRTAVCRAVPVVEVAVVALGLPLVEQSADGFHPRLRPRAAAPPRLRAGAWCVLLRVVPMRAYFLRRLLLIPPTLLGVTLLVFCVTRFAPG